MTSREQLRRALDHREPDRVPVDLGATPVTSMHVSLVAKLRQALALDPPGAPVKVVEPYQMLGEIQPDLVEALGVDVVPLRSNATKFGFPLDDWKPWTLFDGTPVLVPGGFNTQPESNGDVVQYPEGDTSVPPSARMPKDGWYFDPLLRQEPIDDGRLNVEDNCEEFEPLPDDTLEDLATQAKRLAVDTDKGVVVYGVATSFGDVGLVPAPWLKHPKGIRDIGEWYVSLLSRPEYIYAVFERQCEIGLRNIQRLHQAVGDCVQALFVTGTDFGAQAGPLVSVETYSRLFKPFHKRINDWVHTHTRWKTFMHCCGSIMPLVEHFIEAGFDVLNPVQTSADNMDPKDLKERFGDRLTFWGGGVDTQHILPFGTPDQVRDEVRRNIEILAPGGGFVFNPIHNVQAGTPVENVLAMFDAVREYGAYAVTA